MITWNIAWSGRDSSRRCEQRSDTDSSTKILWSPEVLLGADVIAPEGGEHGEDRHDHGDDDHLLERDSWNSKFTLTYCVSVFCQFYSWWCCALQRKSHLCIPFLGIARPQSNFPIHVSVSDLYIPRIGQHISCSRIGRSMMGIYKSITDTWMWNWDCGRAIPFMGILVSSVCSTISKFHNQKRRTPRRTCQTISNQ